MADEKARVSGELPRQESGPILPTVNPDAEKSNPVAPTAALHPAVYVV